AGRPPALRPLPTRRSSDLTPRARAVTRRGALRGGQRHVLGGTAAPLHQQHHRTPRLHRLQPALQLRGAADAVASDGDDDVAVPQARLAGSLALGADHLHALAFVQPEPLALFGGQVARLEAEAGDPGGLGRCRLAAVPAAVGTRRYRFPADGHLDRTQAPVTEDLEFRLG